MVCPDNHRRRRGVAGVPLPHGAGARGLELSHGRLRRHGEDQRRPAGRPARRARHAAGPRHRHGRPDPRRRRQWLRLSTRGATSFRGCSGVGEPRPGSRRRRVSGRSSTRQRTPPGRSGTTPSTTGTRIVSLEVTETTTDRVGSTQHAWLRRDLAATDRTWKIVFFHEPLFDGDDARERYRRAGRSCPRLRRVPTSTWCSRATTTTTRGPSRFGGAP